MFFGNFSIIRSDGALCPKKGKMGGTYALYMIGSCKHWRLPPKKNNNTPPGELCVTFHSRNKGKEKDKIMERIFSFLQYIYSVMLHANEPSPWRRFADVDETVFSMADFSRYWQEAAGCWQIKANHAVRNMEPHVSIEISFLLPAFLIAARNVSDVPYELPFYESSGNTIIGKEVVIYTADSPETIREKILDLEDTVTKIWAHVIHILANYHDPEIFKTIKFWSWWKAEMLNFLNSAQSAAFTRGFLESAEDSRLHFNDIWEAVGWSASGLWPHRVQEYAWRASPKFAEWHKERFGK